MAYADTKQTEVGAIKKNNRGDFIKVTACENPSTKAVSVDIREFYTNDNDEILPTKKGIRVSDEAIAELVEYIYNACSVEGKEELRDRFKAILDTSEEQEPEVHTSTAD
jgi:ribonucleotide reductase alpha subunit